MRGSTRRTLKRTYSPVSIFVLPVSCGRGVSTYGLAERPALADGNLVTLLNTEGGGNVGGEVLVAALVTGVLGDEVEVLAADDEGTVHLSGDDGAGKDTATDGDETSEGALLVCTAV